MRVMLANQAFFQDLVKTSFIRTGNGVTKLLYLLCYKAILWALQRKTHLLWIQVEIFNGNHSYTGNI